MKFTINFLQVIFSADQTYELMKCLEDVMAAEPKKEKLQVILYKYAVLRA